MFRTVFSVVLLLLWLKQLLLPHKAKLLKHATVLYGILQAFWGLVTVSVIFMILHKLAASKVSMVQVLLQTLANDYSVLVKLLLLVVILPLALLTLPALTVRVNDHTFRQAQSA